MFLRSFRAIEGLGLRLPFRADATIPDLDIHTAHADRPEFGRLAIIEFEAAE